MIVLYCFIYWIIGLIYVWFKSKNSVNYEEPAWVVIWTFGPLLWPAILINDVIYIIRSINKEYLDKIK